MSVAFRRDSDEEHKEPRFELPIPVGPNLVTPSGLAQIEARVVSLEREAAGEHDEARLAEINRDLRYWRTRRATAQFAPPPPDGEVGFGSRVSTTPASAKASNSRSTLSPRRSETQADIASNLARRSLRPVLKPVFRNE